MKSKKQKREEALERQERSYRTWPKATSLRAINDLRKKLDMPPLEKKP